MKTFTKKMAIVSAIGLAVGLAGSAQAQTFFLGHGLPGLGSPVALGVGVGHTNTDVNLSGAGTTGETNGFAGGLGIGQATHSQVLWNNSSSALGLGGGLASSDAQATVGAGGGSANASHDATGVGVGIGLSTLSAFIGGILP